MRSAGAAAWLLVVLGCSGGGDSQGFAPDGGTDAGFDATVKDGGSDANASGDATADATSDGPPDAAGDAAPADTGRVEPIEASADSGILHPCQAPGTVQYTSTGTTVVDGGAVPPQLAFLHVPAGFCAHYFGNVPDARQIRIAPTGEAFVTSPTTQTTGGGSNGLAAIVVLPDDNHDGTAEAPVTFQSSLPSTQGLLFVQGYLYYQDGTRVLRTPYVGGQRTAAGPGEAVIDVQVFSSTIHWPKTFDLADDGTIYVGNGGDQGEQCMQPSPFHGGILRVDGTSGGAQVTKGMRNPIAVRCQRGHDLCFALELALDFSNTTGGREKLLPIRQGDDWGFPCCGTTGVPYSSVMPTPDCSGVAAETDSWIIGDTPFGLDFEQGLWPSPYRGSAFITLHGAASSWTGARLVTVAVDPSSGMPQTASDLTGNDTGAMADFLTGWDDGSQAHGRPAAVTFAPDGRLFVTNDNTGDIFWIAPLGL